jgi:hypothetical protein
VPIVWFALSFQEQVEKYGVYVGIASFFGLALLSVLYFSQARELKRLREWAGRAPERARDLEQRVVAQATASVARRAPQMPVAPGKPAGAIAPARRLAEMPAPVAQQPATGVAEEEAAPEDAPATNGNVPGPAGAATAAGAAAAAGAPAAGDAPPQDAETPESDAAAEGEVAAGNGAAPAGADTAGVPPAPGQETQEHAFDKTGEHEHEPEPVPDDTGDHELDETGEHDLDTGEQDAEAGAVAAGDVPRLTPAQRVGVTPRPAPLPLRQSQPSATPAGRRPAAPPGRRPAPGTAPDAPSRRSAGTIVLLAGLAVLLLGGTAFGLASILGNDEGSPPPNNAAPPPTQTAEPGTGPTVANVETTIGVLNGTTTNGLAATVADRLQQDGGYARGTTATNADQTLTTSTVYYADGFRAQGRRVAQLLAIDAVEPITEEAGALAPDADVVVLAGADQATQ